jgi:hypothetical protein
MELQAEVVINAPARAAWALLGERFGEIDQWAVAIVQSSVDSQPGCGTVRTCQIARFGPFPAGTVKERLFEFDPMAMSLAYESADGMPAFVSRAINRWSICPEGAKRCLVRTNATLELSGLIRLLAPMLAFKLRGDAARVLDQLRYRLEHGRPHPSKLAA